jgi:hypothetical protein
MSIIEVVAEQMTTTMEFVGCSLLGGSSATMFYKLLIHVVA